MATDSWVLAVALVLLTAAFGVATREQSGLLCFHSRRGTGGSRKRSALTVERWRFLRATLAFGFGAA